ncbi:MAG: preprotein translocase subunit SecE [Pseudomonadota bacterium]
MPKSKNRRKSKGAKPNPSGMQTEIIEGEAADTGARAERAEASGAAVKKPSVGPVQFFQQVRAEMQKVTWTSRGEVLVSSIMVLVMVAIMSLFFFTVDQILRWIVPNLLSLNLF